MTSPNSFSSNSPDSLLTSFVVDGVPQPVVFVERYEVKDGVWCDVYSFVGDASKDLAVVTVSPGCSTPQQKVVDGDKTLEGYINGSGVFTVVKPNGSRFEYYFKPDIGTVQPVEVMVGDIMQWAAKRDESLTFYEICYPPYVEGRFVNHIAV